MARGCLRTRTDPLSVGHIPSGPAPVIHIEGVTRFYKVYDAARRQPEYLPGVTPNAALKQRLRWL
jgi:hypothetical protein